MYVRSIEIHRFRSIHHDLLLTIEPGITCLVGENSTGKSTIGMAMQRLMTANASNGFKLNLSQEDYPYGQFGKTQIELEIELNDEEIDDFISGLKPISLPKVPNERASEAHEILRNWLRARGKVISLFADNEIKQQSTIMKWGDFSFLPESVAVGTADTQTAITNRWHQMLADMTFGHLNTGVFRSLTDGKHIQLDSNPIPGFIQNLQSHFKFFDEFTTRPMMGQKSSALESLAGGEIASVLFNLKNHPARGQRERYEEIKRVFATLFPRFSIEAVERNTGSNIPDVQFYEDRRRQPMSLSQVSAGICQMLTLIVNLVGQAGFFIFLQHPENHLHPQARRLFMNLLNKAASDNQIVLVTHDPYFIDPRSPQAIRRVWWVSDMGTQVRSAPVLAERSKGQIETVLRRAGNRELLFARAVVLVEDESQQLFVQAVAPALGSDLDANSISVIPVDGDSGYPPFFTLLASLGIPFVALKDKPWGDDTRYPQENHFSFGCELEDFLDKNGLKKHRENVIAEVGTQKPRVAAELGRRLTKEQVPELFGQLIARALNLATGFPTALPNG